MVSWARVQLLRLRCIVCASLLTCIHAGPDTGFRCSLHIYVLCMDLTILCPHIRRRSLDCRGCRSQMSVNIIFQLRGALLFGSWHVPRGISAFWKTCHEQTQGACKWAWSCRESRTLFSVCFFSGCRPSGVPSIQNVRTCGQMPERILPGAWSKRLLQSIKPSNIHICFEFIAELLVAARPRIQWGRRGPEADAAEPRIQAEHCEPHLETSTEPEPRLWSICWQSCQLEDLNAFLQAAHLVLELSHIIFSLSQSPTNTTALLGWCRSSWQIIHSNHPATTTSPATNAFEMQQPSPRYDLINLLSSLCPRLQVLPCPINVALSICDLFIVSIE